MEINEYRRNLGKILKQQRISANLTLHQLSSASGVSPSHLTRIEKGERFPSADILHQIATPLGFSEEELFTLAGYLSPHLSLEGEKTPPITKKELDPYVANILAQEPVEVQRAVVGVLTLLKSLAASIVTPKSTEKPQDEVIHSTE
jgi:transcriptional regulator with XRE-family HTH domain